MKELHWVEGTYNCIPPQLAPGLRRAMERVRGDLRPRLRPLSEAGGRFRIDGIIGTIQLDPTTLLRVEPKTEPGEDWVGAVLELVLPSIRVDAIPYPARPQHWRRRDPLDAIAGLYLARLERALRRDGPLLVLTRTQGEGQVLKGRLLASQWLRHATWRPHILPFEHNQLSPDNVFTRVLAYTSALLARASTALQIRVALAEAARLLRPGYPDVNAPPPVAFSLDVPAQWAVYRPAWEIAKMVLGSRSLMGQTGKRHGLTLAIEAWPLLEQLLHRVLRRAGTMSGDIGRALKAAQQSDPLLTHPEGSATGQRYAIPDGRLLEGDRTIAVFDAKYSRRSDQAEWPRRSHTHQVLVAAAASGAETAVLAYPESFPPASWHVSMGPSGPKRLVCVGMDMFHFTGRRDEEELRAKALLEAVLPAGRSDPMVVGEARVA